VHELRVVCQRPPYSHRCMVSVQQQLMLPAPALGPTGWVPCKARSEIARPCLGYSCQLTQSSTLSFSMPWHPGAVHLRPVGLKFTVSTWKSRTYSRLQQGRTCKRCTSMASEESDM
jgi:hypothetical protein